MKIVNINELSIVDFNVCGIVAINQKWNNACKYSYLRVPRPDHGFNLITHGSIEYIDSNGKITRAKKGDITYLPKGKHYDTNFTSRTEQHTSCILVNFIITDSAGEQLAFSKNILNMGSINDISIEKSFRTIAATYKTSADKLKSKILFMELLQKIALMYNSQNTNITSMEKCIEYINRHFIEDISIKELAQKCCISETTFRKRFKEAYGISPVKYINQKKIDFACEMLLSSDIKINEIAEILKFYDTSYFYKTFTEIKKITPAQYRQENL